MQMIVAITGRALIIMYVAMVNLKFRSGSYAVIMLVPVIEGYIAGNFMRVV